MRSGWSMALTVFKVYRKLLSVHLIRFQAEGVNFLEKSRTSNFAHGFKQSYIKK